MWVRNPGVSRITQPVCTCVHLGSPGLLPCLLPGGHMSARTPQFPGCILSCNQGWVSEGWTLFWGLHSGARPELVLGPGSHPKWEEIHTGQQARRGQEDCWLSLSSAGKAKGGLGTGAEASKGLARKWSVWGQLDMSIYAWLLHLCEAATCGPGPHL